MTCLIELIVSLASTLQEQIKIINVKTSNGDTYPVEVKIPRGVRPGSTVKYSGLGDNFFTSLPRGDLYVKVNIEANAEFGVENIDLHKTIDIDCVRAMIGGTIVVRGLDGKQFDINIPAGTQPETIFSCRGEGLPQMRTKQRGNLLVKIKIDIPKNLSQTQKELIEKIKTNGI